jgi:hypothetical protein
MAPSDSGDEGVVGGGSVAVPPDAGGDGDAHLPCGTGVCGSIAMPAADGGDAGEASVVGGGITVSPDSGPDAFFGLIIHPEAGRDQ